MYLRTSLLALIIWVSNACFSQNDTSFSYLRLSFNYKQVAFSDYVTINPEQGSQSATELYNLKQVKIKVKEDFSDPDYYWYKDMYKVKYDTLVFKQGNNAFRTITEGLNFLAEKGWQLHLIEENIHSIGTTAQVYNNTINLPDIVSNPVYIFRKRISTL